MRMAYFLMGGKGKNLTFGGYRMKVTVTGGTKGIIGEDVSAISPASFLVTGGGTLLVATGYGPMLRMRQNENHLSTAGVPRPFKAPIISAPTADDTTFQPTFYTIHFDFTQYGRVNGAFNASTGVGMSGVNSTRPGQSHSNGQFYTDAYDARMLAFRQVRNIVVPDQSNPAVFQDRNNQGLPLGYTNPGFQAMAQQNAYDKFLGVTSEGTGVNRVQVWKYMAFDLIACNQAAYAAAKFPSAESQAASLYSGRYQVFMRYVDKDGNPSDPSPISQDVTLTNAQYIQITNLETPTDPRVVRRQIFRNISGIGGNFDAFYLDIDTTDLTSTELISRNTDAQLKLAFGQPVFDDNGYNLFYLYGEPPNDKPYIIEYNGAVFAAGSRPYSDGNIIVTHGSTAFTGIGTAWPSTFQGRLLVIGSDTYNINTIDPVAQTGTIDKPYAGPDSQFSDYQIIPYYGNSNLVQWSEPGKPESWPIQNNLSLPDDDDKVTGLVYFANSMWILKNNSIWQFNSTIDPNRDGDYKPASHRGCINQRCAVQAQNVCFMLDRQGIHVFRGILPRLQYQPDSQPDHLSKPVGDMFRFEGTWLRLNWSANTDLWHGCVIKELNMIRWYVALQGYRLPQHSISYDYLMDRWCVEEYPIPITSSTQSAILTGKPILGGWAGKAYQPDLGTLDLTDGQDTRLTVTDCIGGVVLQLDGTPSTCVGLPVAIVAGRGRGQQSTIIRQSGTEIEVDLPFFTWPDDTSTIQIGGIKYYAQTGEFNFAKLEMKNAHKLSFLYRPTEKPLEMYVKVFEDGLSNVAAMIDGQWGSVTKTTDDPDVWKVDMTSDAGAADINMDGFRERDIPERYSIQASIEGFSGEEKPNINNLYIIGASQKQDYAV